MTMTFTTGNDTFTVPAGPGTYDLDFLAGNDRLNVQGGDLTTAHMGDGDDLVELKLGLATVYGDAGLDKFDIWASDVTVDGGADSDTFNFRGGSGQTATGGIGNDRFNFYADGVSVTLNGGDGNDDFYGYGHQVSGTINGGLGSDYFNGFVAGTTLAGGGGNDVYRATAGNVATFLENPGEGIDSVQVARGQDYTLPDNIENISVQGFAGSVLSPATLVGNALNNSIVTHNNAETVQGLDGNDRISAKGGDDIVYGGNGNDYLDGGTGNDTLEGEAGNDTLQGRTGNDNMYGGTGDDVFYVDSTSDQVFENSGEGTDLIRTTVSMTIPNNVENAYVTGSAGLTIFGNDSDNLIVGGPGNDYLVGQDGNDVVKGGDGNDSVFGDYGSDTLVGGAGNDLLWGQDNGDTLTGGSGNDVFAYAVPEDSRPSSGIDQITDFTPDGSGTGDVLDLSGIDADTTTFGDEAFDNGGNVPGPHHAWYTATVNSDGSYDVIWYGDVNGDGAADFELHVHQIGAASIGGPGSDIVL